MLKFIKQLLGSNDDVEQKVDAILRDIKANEKKFPVIISGISRCIVDIKQLKPVSVSIDQRHTGTTYIRIDRLGTDNNIISTFYDYTQEDHIRIMKEFKDYLAEKNHI